VPIYKITFVYNTIASVNFASNQRQLPDPYFTTNKKGQLIYAFVSEVSAEEAKAKANEIILKVTDNL